jgi:hypothetical protein
MSIEWERRLRQLEARVDDLLRTLQAPAAAQAPVAEGDAPANEVKQRRRDANGRFVR